MHAMHARHAPCPDLPTPIASSTKVSTLTSPAPTDSSIDQAIFRLSEVGLNWTPVVAGIIVFAFRDGILNVVNGCAHTVDIPGFDWKPVLVALQVVHASMIISLDLRQITKLKDSPVSKVLKPFVDEKGMAAIISNEQSRLKVRIAQTAFNVVLNAVFFYSGFLPWFYTFAGKISSASLFGGALQAAVFAIAMKFLLEIINFPFSAASSNTEHSTTTVLKGLLVAAVRNILQGYANLLAVWLEVYFVLDDIVTMAIYPMFIDYRVHKSQYIALKDGKLRDGLYELAKSVNLPLRHVYVSSESDLPTPHIVGPPGNKAVVVPQKLIDNLGTSEVLGLVAREFALWSTNYIPEHTAFEVALVIVKFGLFPLFVANSSLFASLGFAENVHPVVVSFFVFYSTISALEAPIRFLQSRAIRRCEFVGHKLTAKLGHGNGLAKAMLRTRIQTNLPVVVDEHYATFYYKTPALFERIEILEPSPSVVLEDKE